MTGKEKCRYLRNLRIEMAKKYDVEYTPIECNHTGDCSGTCVPCEHELEDLSWRIQKKLGLDVPSCDTVRRREEIEENEKMAEIYKRRFSNPFETQLMGVIED